MIDLTSLGGPLAGAGEVGQAINNRDDVIGYGPQGAMLWQRGQPVQLDASASSTVDDLDGGGVVVGETNGHAVVWLTR